MRSWIALSALALGACAAETSSPVVADHFEVVQGGAQHGVLGAPLDTMISVRLLDTGGEPMSGVSLTWKTLSGGGALTSTASVTDPTGVASAAWRLGFGPESQVVMVSTAGVPSLQISATPSSAEFTQLAVGNSFACGLDADGTAWCWGGNIGGTLGRDSVSWSRVPLRIGDGSLQFTQLAAGDAHVCGRSPAGEVWCWGSRYSAQLGDGVTGAGSATPTRPTGLPLLTTIDAADDGTCGLTVDGSLWCWGSPDGLALYSFPTLKFPGTHFRQIALGDSFGCGIGTDSTVACWGQNSIGQLGQGTTSGMSAVPVPIITPIKANAIDASAIGACAITTARALYCWGEMNGMPGHTSEDPFPGTPTSSTLDYPVLHISLGYYCGAIWRSPASPRLLCPQTYMTDIEMLSGIVELKFGYATLCLRAMGGVTFCKNYSDVADPVPFAYEGTAIPAP